METIKDSKGKVLFEGTKKLEANILSRYYNMVEILEEEGHKFDKDVLLQDFIENTIEFEKDRFENSFKVYF